MLNIAKKKHFEELMFLFKISLSRFRSELSLISRKNLLFLFAKMVNSSKDEILLQSKRWSRFVLSFDGLIFLNVKGEIGSILKKHFNLKD